MRLTACAVFLMFAASAQSQSAAPPLPDIASLLHDVQAHQRQMDATRENYTYLQQTAMTELNKDGGVKKTETEDAEVFYVNGHEVDRTVRKNGKELSASEQAKESDRIVKEVAKAEKTPRGQTTDQDEISVGRLLQIMKYSAPRRETLDGRSTIVFDFTGDPNASTHGRAEDASKKMAGTIWIDEHDREVRRVTAQLEDNFHVGFGLFKLAKGSSFTFEQKLINNELWLPTSAHVHIVARALGVMGFRGEIQVEDSKFQRFHTDTEVKTASLPAKPTQN
jgi:hypothetical protein